MARLRKGKSVEELTTDYRSYLLEELRDPQFASYYLTEMLKDGDQQTIAMGLRDVADAYGVNLEPSVELLAQLNEGAKRLADQVAGIARQTKARVSRPKRSAGVAPRKVTTARRSTRASISYRGPASKTESSRTGKR